ncbi:MAG: efflux RND transporter periplasmic adaptor subunit [Candidatus Krumholzibacteriota bacterium]|nr:efflux RND transporter periplasmic adaptor subunit [Candidatus Krumholzibacteriota bacterium]
MKRGMKIGLWTLVLIVVVAAFAVTAVRRLKHEAVASIESIQAVAGVPVDVVRAGIAPIEDWRTFVGVAEGWAQATLTADLPTRVTEVSARVGDSVPRGAVLVAFDPFDPSRLAMNLEANRAAYAAAWTDSQRIEALFAQGAVSRQMLDHTRAGCDAARAQFLTAERAVRKDTPVAGMVTAVLVQPGDLVEAGQALVTVAAIDSLRVPLELSGDERALVRLGQPARLRLPDGRLLAGRVARAAFSADAESRLFAVDLILANPGLALRPGTLVTPEVLVLEGHDLPLVPETALTREDGRVFLYVLDDAGDDLRARRREVTLGIAASDWVAVAAGLAPGERVVVAGQNRLNGGARVKIHADLTDTARPGQR